MKLIGFFGVFRVFFEFSKKKRGGKGDRTAGRGIDLKLFYFLKNVSS